MTFGYAWSSVRAVCAAGALLVALVGCSPVGYSTSQSTPTYGSETGASALASMSCKQLRESALARIRTDDTTGEVDAELDALRASCRHHYAVVVDYASMRASAGADLALTCSEYRESGYKKAAVKLARKHGVCEPRAAAAEVVEEPWVCRYDPTYNRDWHDDVLCTNGTDSDRPYLREWDDFVTEDELMSSAREYEEQLNSR